MCNLCRKLVLALHLDGTPVTPGMAFLHASYLYLLLNARQLKNYNILLAKLLHLRMTELQSKRIHNCSI